MLDTSSVVAPSHNRPDGDRDLSAGGRVWRQKFINQREHLRTTSKTLTFVLLDEGKVTSSGLRSASRGNLIVTAVAGGLGVGVLAQSAGGDVLRTYGRNCHPTCSF
jgi:DNA-binding transcriptional LysR family regulator